jgi:hypothetical protein
MLLRRDELAQQCSLARVPHGATLLKTLLILN